MMQSEREFHELQQEELASRSAWMASTLVGGFKMFVVMGATGHTGKVVAERLLEQKRKVRVLGRSKERLQSLEQRGAEAVAVDINDQAALAKAFHGADAAYVMIPPNEKSQDPLGDSGRRRGGFGCPQHRRIERW